MADLAKVIHLSEYAGKFERIEDKAARDMVRYLNQTRQAIIARLADIPGDKFEAQHLRAVMAEVDERLDRFKVQATGALAGGSEEAFVSGAAVVDELIAKTPLAIRMPMLSDDLLQKSLAFNADLITGIGADIGEAINTQVQLGVLGAKTPTEVMKAIGTNLKDQSVFEIIANRAEVIARTEVGRVYS